MKAFYCAISVLFLSPCSIETLAASEPTNPSNTILSHDIDDDASTLLDERQLFLAAEKALMSGHKLTYEKIKESLSNYPLYSYLEFAELRRNLVRATSAQVGDFLQKYPGTPLARKLRIQWLLQAASRNKKKDFLEFYKPGLSSNLTCRYLRFELQNGKDPSLLIDTFTPVWHSHRSLPSSCDPIIRAFFNSELLTASHVWQRMSLALRHGRTRLANYLARKLPKADRQAARRFFRLRKRPTRVWREAKRATPHPYDGEIYTYTLKRLAFRNLDKALRYWPLLQTRHEFSVAEKQQVNEAIAYALVRDEHAKAQTWFTELPDVFSSDAISGWQLRFALKSQNWPLANEWLREARDQGSSLSEESLDYWQARIAQELGHQELAQTQFQRLAKNRSYYGFLASAITGKEPAFHHRPTPRQEEDLTFVLEHQGLQRARELFFLGRLSDARREWLYGKRDLSFSQKHAAAIAANAWGWHDRAIIALASTKTYNDVDIRFPLAYATELNQAANRVSIDPAWAFAITRQESAFMSDAQSPVGATGLMQIMPYTAKFIARKMGKRYRGRQDLLKPTRNIDFGTYYLNHLANQYEGNRVYATAAYNAGPNRVNRWIENQDMAIDVWIENIPFEETRRYVKRVLAYQVIYGAKLKGVASIISDTVAPQVLLARENQVVLAENSGDQ